MHADYAAQDYQVEASLAWPWTGDGVTSFRVLAPASDRMLMVLVFPSISGAGYAHALADARNMPLVPGYGPAVWRENVALVESSADQLNRAYTTGGWTTPTIRSWRKT